MSMLIVWWPITCIRIVNSDTAFILSDTIRDFKKFTAKKIIAAIKEEAESRRVWLLELFSKAGEASKKNLQYKFWRTGNHAIELYSEHFAWDKIQYIHNNPVTAGFVIEPENWLCSSARNYAGYENPALPEVICLKPYFKTIGWYLVFCYGVLDSCVWNVIVYSAGLQTLRSFASSHFGGTGHLVAQRYAGFLILRNSG